MPEWAEESEPALADERWPMAPSQTSPDTA